MSSDPGHVWIQTFAFAVCLQLLRKSESSLVLLDVSQELPELKRVPGLSKWLVKSNGAMYSSWEDAEAKQAILSSFIF